MALLEAAAVAGGLALVGLGLVDIFLTILHPDMDGPASLAMNRAIWRGATRLACWWPGAARNILSMAGALMIAGTILLWMGLQILGFAVMAWPFLDTGFTTPTASPGFVDALYWSGVTFTTLGYGDVLPATPLWKLVALTEAMAGFALVGAAIAFLLQVFEGVDHRDSMSLRMFSETRRTWDGTAFVLRVLDEEGALGVQRHLEAWAAQVRSLHERLYRFQPLALYVRTRSEKHDPERMLGAVGEAVLAAALLGRGAGLDGVRAAAEEIDIAFTEFARSTVHHHGSRRALLALDASVPTDEDRAHVREVWQRVRREAGVAGETWGDEEDERHVLGLAARTRVFLEEIERITRWHEIAARAARHRRVSRS